MTETRLVLKGPNNSLKLLAEGLAAHGIASVRYDKRGIGETGKAMQLAAEKTKTVLREEDLSFETYIDDAVRWGKQLRADRRFSSLTVLRSQRRLSDRHGCRSANGCRCICVHCRCRSSRSTNYPGAS